MSEFFNAPYATANRTILRAALRNRKLADQLIKQIHDLQLYVQANAGTITKWVMPSDIVPSTDTPYHIDTATVRSQMTMALNSEYIASFMLNVIRELQIVASITPIMNSYVTYKKPPFKVTLQKQMIAVLANRKLGKLLQEAIYELQVQIGLLNDATFTCTADAVGVAGNKTVVGDGVSTFSQLIGTGWTASAGGSLIPAVGESMVIAGGVDAIPAVAAQFTGTNGGDLTTSITIDADVAGAAGNITLVADSISTIAQLVSAWNLANPSNTVTVSAGDDTQVPTVNIVLAGGTDAVPGVAASFTGTKLVALSQPMFA